MPRNPDELVRKGDFLVPLEDFEEAERSFSRRSPRSRGVDKALRGPIVSDVDVWKRNQSVVDYPGVDTPTADPDFDVMDFPRPGERSKLAAGESTGGVELDPLPDPDETLMEGFDKAVEQHDRQKRTLFDAIRGR